MIFNRVLWIQKLDFVSLLGHALVIELGSKTSRGYSTVDSLVYDDAWYLKQRR